jgi:hypothetical protein
MLRVGRIALTFQTKDRSMTGAWDPDSRQWVTLDDGVYREAIRTGMSVASGTIAPEIINVPIVAPELAQ